MLVSTTTVFTDNLGRSRVNANDWEELWTKLQRQGWEHKLVQHSNQKRSYYLLPAGQVIKASRGKHSGPQRSEAKDGTMRATYRTRSEVMYHVGAAEPPNSKANLPAPLLSERDISKSPSSCEACADDDDVSHIKFSPFDEEEETGQWERLQDFLGRASSRLRCTKSLTNYLCLHGPAVNTSMELLRDVNTGRPSLPGEVFPVRGHKSLEPGTRVDVLSTDTNSVLTGTVSPRDSSGGDFDVTFDSGGTCSIIPGQTQFAIRGNESTLPKMEDGSEIDALDCCGTQRD
jgi:hypothetical protein